MDKTGLIKGEVACTPGAPTVFRTPEPFAVTLANTPSLFSHLNSSIESDGIKYNKGSVLFVVRQCGITLVPCSSNNVKSADHIEVYSTVLVAAVQCSCGRDSVVWCFDIYVYTSLLCDTTCLRVLSRSNFIFNEWFKVYWIFYWGDSKQQQKENTIWLWVG